MLIEIVKITNDSNTHHSVLIKQQSEQKLSKKNVLFISCLG